MASCVLRLLSFVYVVFTTHAQSTRSEYPGCVCTVNVPPSDCGQRSCPSVDVQLLRSSVVALQEQVVTLASDNRKLADDNRKLADDNRKLADDVGNLRRELSSNTGTIKQASSTGGAVYTRWGRKTCPGNGTDLVYWGVAAGSLYTHSGGVSNYLCLPRNPEWGKTTAGFQNGESLYGAEYQTYATNDPFPKVNGRSLENNDVPCAVCLVTSRLTKLMIPARLTCPDGWTKEYSGYLMAQHRTQTRTTYVCVDNAPEVIEGGAANQNGVLFYNVEAVCGSLPCPSYVDDWEVTCVVCTK